ncbi:hypothetical protein QA612_04420 [Evansella sp. AB-P1]|uniref:hypothetical protein n=1 Tax=Evansella sp. AB-P1 TaxID=3037653 RepID=UPI00241EAD2A|nr:hypothetical protein [Evansella sp. AB-P1]MDG5786726.1 hypothetical protein [Evansella sp. AB-P1]
MDKKVKRAYEILDVPESASREEIEEKYSLWLLRFKHEQVKERNISEINRSYSTIKNELERLDNLERFKINPDKSPFRKKVDHIIYYYKFHIIAAIFIIGVGTYLMINWMDAQQERAQLESLPEPELGVMIYGPSRTAETDLLEDRISSLFPEWERVAVEFNFAPLEIHSEFDLGEQQSSIIALMYDESDLFISDTEHYYTLLELEFFQPLTDMEEELEEMFGAENLLYDTLERSTEEELYGIDLTGHPIFDDLELVPDINHIAAIPVRIDNKENIFAFFEKLAE